MTGTGYAQSSPRSQAAAFWRWFTAHDGALFAVKTGSEPVCDTLMTQMQTVDSNLTFEFGPVQGGRREFVISAGGIRAAFPAVEELAAAAPALERWRITRFRPRREPMRLKVGSLTVDPSDVEVLAEADGAKIALIVSIRGYHETPTKQYQQAAFLLLDQALGEYVMETRIGGINILAPEGRPSGAWTRLKDLPDVIDGWRDK